MSHFVKMTAKGPTTCRSRHVFAAMMWLDELCQDLEEDSASPVGSGLYCLSSRQWGAGPNHSAGSPGPHPLGELAAGK